MSKIKIENCLETGISSLIEETGEKIDLKSDESADLCEVLNDTEKIKSIIGKVDPVFFINLDSDKITYIRAGV